MANKLTKARDGVMEKSVIPFLFNYQNNEWSRDYYF